MRTSRSLASSLISILPCWLVFLALMRRVWPHVGIGPSDALYGAAAYGLAFQIPGMVATSPFVRVLGWSVPVMHNPYIGPWISYSLVPFVAILGCTVAALRCYTACAFLLALWGTRRLALDVCRDRACAFLCALALAALPVMALDGSCELAFIPVMAAGVWSVCFALDFARSRRPRSAIAACAALSAAICSGPWAAGLAAGLLLFAALNAGRCRDLLARTRPAAGGALAAGFFLLPVAAYNLSAGGETFRFLAERLVRRDPLICRWGDGTCSNLDFLANLAPRLRHLAALSDGFAVVRQQPWHWLYVGPLLLSLAAAARAAWRRRSLWSAEGALWTIVIGFLLSSAFTPTELHAYHVTAITPLLIVLMLASLRSLPAAWRKPGLAAMALVCAAQLFGDYSLLAPENVDLAGKGWYMTSNVLPEVCRFAGERPRTAFVSLSLSFSADAPFFTRGQARLLNLDYDLMFSPDKPVVWKDWLRREDKPLFVAENDAMSEKSLAALKAAAAEEGLTLAPVESFADGRGRPAFEIYGVR